MRFFKFAKITTAKLKCAFMGFQGSGKTWTATDLSIGLVKMMRELRLPEGDKPIAFADTERSARWVLPQVQAAGLTMATVHTRAFSDLCGLVDDAEAGASVLIIDSLTHFWNEFCETYAAQKAEQYHLQTYRLQFQDWAFLKAKWRTFTDRFVNSNLHIVICGRAGYEYDMEADAETGKKQLEKTGIKFKAEGEMGYEPDLLILMERIMNMQTKADEHIAHVVKDRSTLLDGKEFVDPTFKDFLPHIERLNMGAQTAEISIDTSRTSATSIPKEAPRDRKALERKIVIDEINDLLMRHDASGTSGAAQKKRSDLLMKHFKTVSKTAIEEVMSGFDLRAGYDSLHRDLEGKPSCYTATPAVGETIRGTFTEIEGAAKPTLAQDMNDELPTFADLVREGDKLPPNILGAG